MAVYSMIFSALWGMMLLTSVAAGEEKSSALMVHKITDMDALDSMWRLQPWNVISIRVLEDKRDAIQQAISASGEVVAPYLGTIKAAGLTCRELALKIKAGLEPSFFEHATVLVVRDSKDQPPPSRFACPIAPPSVVIFGKAAKTGTYDLPDGKDLTVSAFLARAGGHTSSKAIPVIRIVRKTPAGTKTILINSKAVLIQKDRKYDLILRAGDVMLVE